MGGGLMQLVAYGAQDIYLTGNPQITFFKVVYRRHTNFSMETIRQTFNGSGTSVTSTISRNGDLVYKLYVTSAATTTNGSAFVSEAELEIGGQRIDRHFQEWNEIWNELSTDESKAIGLKSMIGCVGTVGDGTGVNKIHVPLNFWFCRNPGLALPLIALQYHEVKVKLTLAGATGGNTDLWADYIYLDTDERRRFAQVSHEYLIEQVQRQSLTTTLTNKLNFNHPVKELIWTTTGTNYTKAHIKLNGHDRFALQEPEYFQLRQPYDYHTAVPKQNLPTAARVSLLDRQTSLDQIHAAGQADGLISLGGGAATGVYTSSAASGTAGNFNITNGVLTLGIGGVFNPATASTGALAVGSAFPVGSQLAIVCSTSDGTAGATTVAVATQGTVGTVYFATVLELLAAETTANAVSVRISTPTSTDSTLTLVNTGDNADATFNVFAVTNGNSNQARTSQMTNNINVYSFALKPEEHQPSGTCNFSRIDNAQLVCTGVVTDLSMMYAVNYNVLRIMSGMGGLAYSN